MSRGPGRLQRGIIRLIEQHPDEVFSSTKLCQHFYGGSAVQKRQRVAVLRAMRSVKKPGWRVGGIKGRARLLYDGSSERGKQITNFIENHVTNRAIAKCLGVSESTVRRDTRDVSVAPAEK
jgi:hypothetical protein